MKNVFLKFIVIVILLLLDPLIASITNSLIAPIIWNSFIYYIVIIELLNYSKYKLFKNNGFKVVTIFTLIFLINILFVYNSVTKINYYPIFLDSTKTDTFYEYLLYYMFSLSFMIYIISKERIELFSMILFCLIISLLASISINILEIYGIRKVFGIMSLTHLKFVVNFIMHIYLNYFIITLKNKISIPSY